QLDDAKQWTQEVERIAAQALWTPTLTLLNATSRLSGLVANCQKTNGKRHPEWGEWKQALIERFRRRLSMKDFIELKAKRTMRRNETLVQYIFEKDALLEKSPHPLTPEERISMIIGDIKDTKLSIPLASHLYSSVTELDDRAASLESLRYLETEGSNDKKTQEQERSHSSSSSTQSQVTSPKICTAGDAERRGTSRISVIFHLQKQVVHLQH
ncbi:unnamed protein product, partial [Ixodes persulcatus]